jgi:hypothetical protein
VSVTVPEPDDATSAEPTAVETTGITPSTACEIGADAAVTR